MLLPIDTGHAGDTGYSPVVIALAVVVFIWYLAVLALAYAGVFEILTTFRRIKTIPSVTDPLLLEGVSILRPLKGIDP